MATDSNSKIASNLVTKEIESRIKQTPEHLFEVFLEIREPKDDETPEILLKYPKDFTDDILKTAPSFAYPCNKFSDEQGEHFAFVVLDTSGTLFRFGYCRRSNRENTCLCIISLYPWFEVFYTILNDLAQIINSKALNDPSQPSVLTEDVEQYLSCLYNYQLISTDDKKETIEIRSLSKTYTYTRPDARKLPSMLYNRNFAVMFSRLGPEIMLNLFANLLFERRILFVSSKLFHLTACAYGCLHLIYPMHWQSIFLPILPSSMLWTTQCTAPYIIGIHSSLLSTLNMSELGDVVIVNIDERKLDTQYNDLNSIPKYITRSMKKSIQQSSQSAGDNLARVFLRAMAFAIGNYGSGFVIRNDKLDFDRDLYLQQYLGSHVYTFMSSVAHTQMFEQFSRYRTYLQLQRETDIDEFDIEVKNYQQLQQTKKFKTNKKIYKLLEKYIKSGTIISDNTSTQKDDAKTKRRSLFDTKDERNKAANPLVEQVQNKAGKLQTAINKAGQRVASEASSVRNNLSSFDINGVIKRAQISKINDSNTNNRFSLKLPMQQSNMSDLTNDESIPYERFNFDNTLTSLNPQLLSENLNDSSTSSSSRSSTPEPEPPQVKRLISLELDDNPLLPSPIVLNVINTPVSTTLPRQTSQVDSKIKKLQNELQHKVQTFDGKRIDPRNDYGPQTEIKKLVKQFDPLDESNKMEKIFDNTSSSSSSSSVIFRINDSKLSPNISERHPSLFETIPTNHVNHTLQNIHTNYGTASRFNLRPSQSPPQNNNNNNLIQFSPESTAPIELLSKLRPTISGGSSTSPNFDPLTSSTDEEKILFRGSNLIDF